VELQHVEQYDSCRYPEVVGPLVDAGDYYYSKDSSIARTVTGKTDNVAAAAAAVADEIVHAKRQASWLLHAVLAQVILEVVAKFDWHLSISYIDQIYDWDASLALIYDNSINSFFLLVAAIQSKKCIH
jgi:hypothetical protein